MSKNNKTLLLIFIFLLAISLLPKIKSTFFAKEKAPKKTSVELSKFSEKKVKKVSIKNKDEELSLELVDGKWNVNGQEADQKKVELFFEDIVKTETIKQSSKNQENHHKFEVTPETSKTLTFNDGKENNAFFIGKKGQSFQTFYIRKQGIANVYLVQGGFFDKLERKPEDWKVTPPEEEITNDMGQEDEN